MSMFFHPYFFWGFGWFWGIPWIFFLIWAVYRRRGYRYGPMRQDSPLDILRKRYASGEINTQEYQERKKVLEDEMKNGNR